MLNLAGIPEISTTNKCYASDIEVSENTKRFLG
jgi:hypothetical protein